MPKNVLTSFRDGVLASFQLSARVPIPKRRRMLFYGHFSTKRRHWVGMKDTMRAFSKVMNVKDVYDFGRCYTQY
jgi:hypothetical protein